MKIITVASSKGGIGKTTVALGVSEALIEMGMRVLICDLDFANACLDILTDSEPVYNLGDVAEGRCKPADAVIKTEGGLSLLAAAEPACERPEGFNEKVAAAIKEAAEAINCDYVILDTGAGQSEGFEIAASISDSAIIVATHSPVSLRSADNTAQRLRAAGIKDNGMVINSYDSTGVLKYGQHTGLVEIIDSARVRLIGVVPFDYELVLQAERDENARPTREAKTAFYNIAQRITGKDVPIFSGMRKLRRQRGRLF